MADSERLISIERGKSRVVFDPQGSMINELVLDGHLVSGSVARYDRVARWHPCGPNFDTDKAGILPRHGTLRNTLAEVVALRRGDSPASIRTRTLILADQYPEVEILRLLTLSQRALTVESWYSNFDHLPAPVNHGEHVYFHAPRGWEGTTLNNRPLNDRIRNDSVFRWNAFNGLQIPGQPLILIHQVGLPYANAWTGKNNEGVYDTSYFSLSAVQGNPRTGFFGSRESLIPPHVADPRKKSLTLSIIIP